MFKKIQSVCPYDSLQHGKAGPAEIEQVAEEQEFPAIQAMERLPIAPQEKSDPKGDDKSDDFTILKHVADLSRS